MILLLLFVKDIKALSAWHECVRSVNLKITTLDLRPIHTILAAGGGLSTVTLSIG